MRRMISIGVLTALAALTVAGASASGSTFSQIGGAHPAARVVPAHPDADADLPISPEEARRRIDTYLTAQGFELADTATKIPTAVGYVKFADREGFRTVADCRRPVIGEPELWLETVVIDLQPQAAGVHMLATGQFQVIMKGLVSGAPFKMSCRSVGALEGRVRDAVSRE